MTTVQTVQTKSKHPYRVDVVRKRNSSIFSNKIHNLIMFAAMQTDSS
ncbi:unnamed protein product [Haemonchus placei]|uniref:Transposase n=1 Tax=Haemonchus placei TaxID=6290 RepID=A0A0N4WV78_HAEPC|nr:unnamed protein product [Haemonchus placei]